MEKIPSLQIGTSGFSFEDWKGTVYPEHLKKEEWLSYYERVLGFNALEVNYTYYTLPSSRSLGGMERKTSPGFQFVIKAFRGMTHEIKSWGTSTSIDNRDVFKRFLSALEPLIQTEKLGCVLAQFPYSFSPQPSNLDYLKFFKENMEPIPLTVEFRNRKWLTRKTLEFLQDLCLGYCIVDEPKLSSLVPFHADATSPIGYFRFHGRNKNWFNVPTSVRYDYLYSHQELCEFKDPIIQIAGKTQKVFIFFNNCHAGSAVENARMLMKLLDHTPRPQIPFL